jgi:hypothetical protein
VRRRHAGGVDLEADAAALADDGDPADVFFRRQETVPAEGTAPMKDETALYYALSTIAQCAAALAALLGFFGLQALERLRQEEDQAERRLRELFLHGPPYYSESTFSSSSREGLTSAVRHKLSDPDSLARMDKITDRFLGIMVEDLETIADKRQQLMDVLVIFLLGTLAVLVIAIGLIPFAEALYPWVWTMRVCITGLSLWLGVAPAYVVLQAAGGTHVFTEYWARWVIQVQHVWTRARQWDGPALIVERLQGAWRRQRRKGPR